MLHDYINSLRAGIALASEAISTAEPCRRTALRDERDGLAAELQEVVTSAADKGDLSRAEAHAALAPVAGVEDSEAF